MSLHPGAWLLWALCAGLVAMSTTNPFYLGPLAAVAWVVYEARALDAPAPRSFRAFVAFGVAALLVRTALVVLGPLSSSAVAIAALEGLRLAVLLAVFGAFNSVTDPHRLLKLAPRRAHEPALAAVLALSIAPRYVEAAARVRDAQRMRGIDVRPWRSLPALAVPVLETGMEEALSLAESMDARGHGRGPRSRYRPDRFGPGSIATAATSAAAAAVFLGADRAAADIVVSVFPLRWPDASWVHVASVLALAAPAVLPRRLR